jgi:hypothetical protein
MAFLAGRRAIIDFSPDDWSLMFSEARRVGLLGRLSLTLSSYAGGMDSLPDRLRLQVSASIIEVNAFRRDAIRELGHIQLALEHLGIPVVLLKGASYLQLELLAARGRTFNDVDILVAKEHLGEVEASLLLGGWITGEIDPYDQRYYREWSHEVPPMTHRRRGTTIDLHHALVMPTCRIRIDSARMLNDAQPVESDGFWWRLKDEDILLHAISHLMLNSEFERGLRDLWDIDLLFRQFSAESLGFADLLVERALEVGMGRMAQQALFLARQFFDTPVPDRILSEKDSLFVRLIKCATSTRHSETRPRWQGVIDAVLSYREMYLRLPNRLLAVHLAHKAKYLFGSQNKKEI